MNPNDTIAACVTPPGYSSIAVIRVSGERALPLLEKIFIPQNPTAQPFDLRRPCYGTIVEPSTGQPIDKVLASAFPKPNSYTGEDIIEISCHGNPLIVDRIMRTIIGQGARAAGRGEFTKRALLNGKIDLVQAEAVADIVSAPCDQARQLALLQYEGRLSKKIQAIRAGIVDILVSAEAAIDFPEEEETRNGPDEPAARINGLVAEIDDLLKGASIGVKIRNGYSAVITGRANAGKSTLFNRLVGHDRAIIHSQPGTTRDFLEESVQIQGLYVHLCDTAGILSGATGPDQIAQQRAIALIHDADLIILLFDGSEPMNEDDIRLYDLTKAKPKLLVVNKIDLNMRLNNEHILSDSIKISAQNGTNLDVLEETIRLRLLPKPVRGDGLITRHRHIDALQRARRALVDARHAPTPETMAYELRSALDTVGEVTGVVLRSEILDRIFEEFCIGK